LVFVLIFDKGTITMIAYARNDNCTLI